MRQSRAEFECGNCGMQFQNEYDETTLFRQETQFCRWPVEIDLIREPGEKLGREYSPVRCPFCELYKDVETVRVERGVTLK